MLMDISICCSDTWMIFYSVMLVAQGSTFYTSGSSLQEIFKVF